MLDKADCYSLLFPLYLFISTFYLIGPVMKCRVVPFPTFGYSLRSSVLFLSIRWTKKPEIVFFLQPQKMPAYKIFSILGTIDCARINS